MKRLPELTERLQLPFPPECEPVLILEGALRTPSVEDAVAICKRIDAEEVEPSFVLLIFFRGRKGGYERALIVEDLIEAGGRDIEFSGTPRIEDRLLIVVYETSGTGCMSTVVEKWSYRMGLGFELVGYSNSEACLEVGADEDASNETHIDVKTGRRVDVVKSRGHATRSVCRIRGSRRPILLGGGHDPAQKNAPVLRHERAAQASVLECGPKPVVRTNAPRNGTSRPAKRP